MDFPDNLFYTKTHEWAGKEDENKVRVGISSHAQSELGDVVYVELPAVGSTVEAAKECAVIESVKAAYDIYAPVSGKVTEINTDLESNPQSVNEDPYGKGWLFVVEMEDTQQLSGLLSSKEYQEFCEEK